tara:strand:+ start:867 stop:1046 length:180 start_codon:yes stop_codon:yes gene_type:complete
MTKSSIPDQLVKEALHLKAMEDNPSDSADLAIFNRFERENYTPEERRTYIMSEAKKRSQ